MAGFDKSTQRVIAVIALLVVAAWTLRGYVPGSEPIAERERPPSNPAATAVVVAMLSVAVAVIAFAIIARLRAPRSRRPPAGALPQGAGAMGTPTWRFSLIALAAVIGWLLLVQFLSRFGAQQHSDEPVPGPVAPDASSPPRPPDAASQAPLPDQGADTNVVSYLIPPLLVLMVLVVVATAIASRRRQRMPREPVAEAVDDARPPVPVAAASLARAAEVGLAEIGDLSREPREAIIACYAAMEHELTRVPGAVPQDCDTPTEVLARAVERHALRADSATELVELFEEARFSPHVMTEEHRDAAVRALQLVLAELPHAVAGGVA